MMPLSLCLSLGADLGEVRLALLRVGAALADGGASPEALGRVELVLAEVLNNVVEHAYAGRRGDIRVEVDRHAQSVTCRVSDHGAPMPGGALPSGRLQLDTLTELPEGGFGWHMIRTLAHDLRYHRTDGQNVLAFEVPLYAIDE